MDWWNVSVFGVIPVLCVGILFCFRRKALWAAPIFSAVLTILVSVIAMPSVLSDREHSAMLFGIALPIHLVIAVVWTGIAYGAAYLLKKGRSQE